MSTGLTQVFVAESFRCSARANHVGGLCLIRHAPTVQPTPPAPAGADKFGNPKPRPSHIPWAALSGAELVPDALHLFPHPQPSHRRIRDKVRPLCLPHPCGRTLSASARANLPTSAAGTRRSRQVRQPETSAIPHPLGHPLRCRTCPGCAPPLPSSSTFTPAHPRQSPPTLSPAHMWADFVCFGTRQPSNPRRRHPPEQTSSATRNLGHLTSPGPPSPVPNLSRMRSTSSRILNPHTGASETKSAHFVSRTPVGGLCLLRHAQTFQPPPPEPAGADKFGDPKPRPSHIPWAALSGAELVPDALHLFSHPQPSPRRIRDKVRPLCLPHPVSSGPTLAMSNAGVRFRACGNGWWRR